MGNTGKASVRLDKWLWAVRFFKTRSMAASACNAGKVKRGGHSLKPASPVKIGDHLEVPSPCGTHKKSIIVEDLIEKRVGAELARKCYQDRTSQELVEQAQQLRRERLEQRKLRKEGDQGRMTKKQRRMWERQKNGGL